MISPRVTVIIPTRDRAAGAVRAVESVLAQTFGDFEVLVVDDGSTDGTQGAIRALKDPRVRYEKKGPPHSAAAARNYGARMARAPLLAFNDSGDDWLPEKLSVQMAEIDKMPASVAMVYSSLIRVHRNGQEQRVNSPEFSAGEPGRYRRALALGVNGIYPQTAVIRTAVYRELGGFDQRFRCWEDLEFFLRLAERWDLHFVPGHYTRLFDNARGVSRNFDAMFVAHSFIIEKHRAALAGDPALMIPHYRSIGRRLIPTKHRAYARKVLWIAALSSQAKPADYAWLALSYGGRTLFRLLSAARRAYWKLSGKAGDLDGHGL
jgi:glycosyltransferase involved in cell wall biosynthesis